MDTSPTCPDRVRGTIWHELLLTARFGLVGVAATVVHVSVVFSLVATRALPPLAANLCAFLLAFGVSFIGHYLWTFRSSRHWAGALWRFIAVSGVAFSANNLILLLLLKSPLLTPAAAAAVGATVIPVVTYVLGRFWALR